MKLTRHPENKPSDVGGHELRQEAPCTQTVTIPIFGLSCGAPLVLEHVLSRTPGVTRVYVNTVTEMAYVECDPAVTSPEQLVAAVQHAGFRTGQPASR